MSARVDWDAREEQVRDFIFRAYIDGGKGVTAQEIAEAVGLPIGAVRRCLWGKSRNHALDGCDTWYDHRPSMSRDYPGFQTGGAHRVEVWIPSRRALADRLRYAPPQEQAS